MYYAIILTSVLMYGVCFALRDVYRKMRGSSLRISMESSLFGAVAGALVLLCLNGFRLSFTPFTLWISLVAAINVLAFSFFSFKALDRIDLSLFSVFSMLGGMVLPFLQGVLFYREPITLAKGVAVVLITAALALIVTCDKKGTGCIYYIGIFVLNGMSGVITKLFNELPFEKTGATDYSVWMSLWTVLLSGLALLALSRKREATELRFTWRACGVGSLCGALNTVASMMLVVALLHVDASVQYPMVTGGVMIVSTLISLFGSRKPDKRALLAVAVAFIGTLAIFVIPI